MGDLDIDLDKVAMPKREFHYPDYTYRASVVRVVDGDTIDVDIDVGFNSTLRKRLRLLDIDAYEVRGEERELGLKASARVEDLLNMSEEVFIQTIMDGTGKYGRVLAYIWIKLPQDGGVLKTLNNVLIAEGHAVPYYE